MPKAALWSQLRGLSIATVFAALALAVAGGVWHSGLRGQSDFETDTADSSGPPFPNSNFKLSFASPPESDPAVTEVDWDWTPMADESESLNEPVDHSDFEFIEDAKAIELTASNSGLVPPPPPDPEPGEPIADEPPMEPTPVPTRSSSPLRLFDRFLNRDSDTEAEVRLNSEYEEAPAPSEILREATERDPISVDADLAQKWSAGDTTISLLRGRCRIVQGSTVVFAQKMVVWQTQSERGGEIRDSLRIYLEDDVLVQRPGSSVSDSPLVIEIATRAGLVENYEPLFEPALQDPVYLRAEEALEKTDGRRELDPTQLRIPQGAAPPPSLLIQQSRPASLRRIRFFPRYGPPFNLDTRETTDTTPPELIWRLTGGINVVIDGVEEFGTIDLKADRVVVWTQPGGGADFQAESFQSRDTPFTIYLEGNVVIRQGDNVVRAAQGVYDAREDRALLVNAELRTFLPSLMGDIRVRADRLRQLSRDSFHAQNAYVTPSQFAKPGYRMQASDIYLQNRIMRPWWGQGAFSRDPVTGEPIVREVPFMTALNTKFFVDEVPLLYLPKIAGPAEDPNVPIRTLSTGYDRIFGFQLGVGWDMFQLTGIDQPEGTEWELHTDLYTDRGVGLGTSGVYGGEGLFGVPGTYFGEGLIYYINDGGEDNLGRERQSIPLEEENRYRLKLRHRQFLPGNVDMIAEIGVLSDPNFLEQYWENEYDRDKDQETLLYFKQQYDGNEAWTALFQPRLNDFENETNWVRGDSFILGQPLLNGWVNWSQHSSAGYAALRRGDPPTYSQQLLDIYTPIPYIQDREGAVLMTRHELNAPLQAGPFNIVPFVMGEADFWGEDLNGDSLTRLVGSGGIRGSLFAMRTFPYVQSRIFNLNGLAHKMVFEAEYSYTASDTPIDAIPQYNEIDDNAQQRYRQRFPSLIFGGSVPAQLDPRTYAIRYGAGRNVSDPYHELIDDLNVLRLAWRHRLQTKVGPPERLRIKDWMVFDMAVSYFPDDERDNFGEPLGLLDGHYEWNFGDRTQFVANAMYDFFDGGQEIWNAGFNTQRSERGSLYLGVQQVKGGALNSLIATGSYSYRMSPKWISTFATAYDIREERNAGQSLTVTRVGADFLFHLGANYDAGKDNAGIMFALEPRFGPLSPYSMTQLGSLLPTFR